MENKLYDVAVLWSLSVCFRQKRSNENRTKGKNLRNSKVNCCGYRNCYVCRLYWTV